MYEKALKGIVERGGEIVSGKHGKMDVGEKFAEGEGGNYVWPVVVRPKKGDECWTTE